MRPSGRASDQMRTITLKTQISPYAEGSCLVKFGNTHVLCTASWQSNVPGWMKGQARGWITAEYGMLPRATHTRGRREATQGKPSGRTQEIQRLIGRALRSVTDLSSLGENQIIIDCDVLQADGGTRTAAITGGYVALALACGWLEKEGVISHSPLTAQAAAISCGLYKGEAVVDLDYAEDSNAQADANFVISSHKAGLIEVQCTGEAHPIKPDDFAKLMQLAQAGCSELFRLQKQALNI